jgi:hypothetical protein
MSRLPVGRVLRAEQVGLEFRGVGQDVDRELDRPDDREVILTAINT